MSFTASTIKIFSLSQTFKRSETRNIVSDGLGKLFQTAGALSNALSSNISLT